MDFLNIDSSSSTHTVAIDGANKWEMYHRLQALQIPCQCFIHKPLQVELNSPIAVIHLWSIVQRLTASRAQLVERLNLCWQLEMPQPNSSVD